MLYNADMDREFKLGHRIAEARKRFPGKMTQAELAQIMGVTPQAVSGWERDQSLPELDKLEKLCAALGVDIMWLMQDAGETAHHYLVEVERRRERGDAGYVPAPAMDLAGPPDFPIYAGSEGGDGHLIIHTDVMEYVKRPSVLYGVPQAYGVLIVGESMLPAYRPGDMALVHPNRPLERETDVILYKHDPRSGNAKSMIKRLVSFNDTTLRLEQYNPARAFSVPRKDWPVVHQVVGRYNTRR